MRAPRRAVVIVAALVSLAALGLSRPYVRGAAFVVKAAGMQGAALDGRLVGHRRGHAKPTRPIPWRHGVLRGRVYTPASGRGRGDSPRPGRPRRRHRRAAPGRLRAGDRRHRPSGRHRAARRSRALRDHHADHRHDRGRRAGGLGDGGSRSARPDRRPRDQLRRRTGDRGRRPPVAAGPRRVRHGVRRPRGSAADAQVSLHRHPARWRDPPAARLRPRHRPARARPIGSCRRRRWTRCAPPSWRISRRRAWTWSTRRRRRSSSREPKRSRPDSRNRRGPT